MLQALRRAAHNQPIVIYIFWHYKFTARHLEQELRRMLFIEEGDPWPEGITVVIPTEPVPPHLLEPLDAGKLNPFYLYTPGLTGQVRQQFKDNWERQMHQSFAAKTQAWESYLSRIRGNRSGYGLALIEQQKLDEKKYSQDQSNCCRGSGS